MPKMTTMKIEAGTDKSGAAESYGALSFHGGQVVAICGPTGSGKTRLLSDMERLSQGDSPTRRKVSLTGVDEKLVESGFAVGRISQTMLFFLDLSVDQFIEMHVAARSANTDKSAVINAANNLAGEPMSGSQPLATLSGGQARALMVADLVLVANAPVLLIDEIENAGIDRHAALEFLVKENRLVFLATHDPLIALRAHKRLILGEGAIKQVIETSPGELQTAAKLEATEREVKELRRRLRYGESLA